MSRFAQTAAAPDTVPVAEVRFDRAPVTNERYAEFVRATGHRCPAYWPNGSCPAILREHPVVGIDYFDAIACARWAGGCLPTEYEWVLATGLEEPRAYPWGDRFESHRCNTIRSGRKSTTPVGAYPPAPSGCVDLCGNVWEFTCNASGDDSRTVLVKGGSWFDFPAHAKIDNSFRAPVEGRSATVGFRLCYGRAERLPDFLDPREVEAIIRSRRAGADPVPAATCAEIALAPAVSIEPTEIHAALAQLDRADPVLPISRTPARMRASTLAFASLARVERFLVRQRGALLGVAAMSIFLVATAVGAALSTDGPLRQRGIARAVPSGESTAARRRPAPSRPAGRRVVIRPIDKSAAADRVALESALAEATEPAERRRLRFQLASLDEKERGVGTPVAVTVLPTRGLVFATNRLGAPHRNCVSVLRRIGRAEGIDVTVVYTGTSDFAEWFARYGDGLGRVYVTSDPEGRFRSRHDIQSLSSVVFLHADGRARFTLSGTPDRERIDPLLAANR